ncbi:unnamed protein product [Peronospora belbahrii]|uniref:Arf-GAP domain-containing protein n=1 Tax=Peronospora belbahrii TaxID=622444 RepID=A0ABN8CRH2_9STRA|nr:unnamed protein product [Peronospora belbahrii]
MSRAARAPDDQTKLKKQLNDLMKLDGNKFCADCGCRGPRWASINLGVFICIACSGIHRSLGVHLTFVRSVNLDSWTTEQVQQMQRWGNARAKEYYEANTPRDCHIPTEHSSVREKERWIRDKYERKLFVGDGIRGKEEEERGGSGGGGGRRKKHVESEENKHEEERRRERRQEKSAVRQSSRTISQDSTSKAEVHQRSRTTSQESTSTAATADIVSFDVFSTSVPTTKPAMPSIAPPVATLVLPNKPKQDEWALFGGSINAQSGFQDKFAVQPSPSTDQHVKKMANIMASFGSSTQQQSLQQQSAFTPQQRTAPQTPMMGMQMPMMQPRPMGTTMPMSMPMGMPMMMPMSMPMSMPMNMPMGGQGFMNPMMGQLSNPMMGYPMQNQMLGEAPQQNGMMMGGTAPMGFQGRPIRMNPMSMQMNHRGLQQQQQQQQQQYQYQQQQQYQQPQSQVGPSQPFNTFG